MLKSLKATGEAQHCDRAVTCSSSAARVQADAASARARISPMCRGVESSWGRPHLTWGVKERQCAHRCAQWGPLEAPQHGHSVPEPLDNAQS